MNFQKKKLTSIMKKRREEEEKIKELWIENGLHDKCMEEVKRKMEDRPSAEEVSKYF